MNMADKPKLEIVTGLPDDAADLSDLWLDTGLGDALTDTVWHDIPVGKPRDFFRVHPSPSYRRNVEVYTHKPEEQIEEQHFIVAETMRGRIAEARPALLVTCVSRDGSPRLWPLKFSRSGEKDIAAWTSARAAAREAMTKWVKLVWVKRAYQVREAQPGYAPEPDWGKLPPFNRLVTLALGPNGIIRDTTHPVYSDLIGAAPKAADDDGSDL
jgi:hypothetical protein